MKNVLQNYSNTNQARIFTALVLTGILSIGNGLTLIKSATAAPANGSEETSEVISQNARTNTLPRLVANAVLRDLSRRERIPVKELQITDYSQKAWNNGCLALARKDEFCTEAIVPGWRVVVSNGKQRWTYHTNSNGRNLRLATAVTSESSVPLGLPKSVKDAVLRDASRRLKMNISSFTIMQAKEQTWNDGCLSLARPEDVCARGLVPGWRVVVGAPEQSLVYHTDRTGSAFRLNEKESEISRSNSPDEGRKNAKLPSSIAQRVLADASSKSGVSISRLRIVDVEEREWSNACLGINKPGVLCAEVVVPGWQVTVTDGEQRWVYRVGQTVTISLDEEASKIADNIKPVRIPASELPPALSPGMVFRQISSGGIIGKTYQTVLMNDGRVMQTMIGDMNDSSRRVWRISPESVQDFQKLLQRQQFENVSYPATRGSADYITYTLTSGENTLQYNDVSRSNLPRNLQAVLQAWNQILSSKDSNISENTVKPVRIPASELPPALTRGMVFRQISSGGIMGKTYLTVLMDDGRVMQTMVGDMNDSSRRVWRISPESVRDFQKLLQRQQFENVSYPATSGSADYITYTLTSGENTLQYNDVSRNNLPENLLAVVQAWNQISSRNSVQR
jgi:outer membrane lipoprotein-sorting protein